MLVESYGFGCPLWSCSRILLCFSHGVICKPLRKDRPTLHPLFAGNHSSSGSHAISTPFAPLRCDKLSQERWKPRLSKFKKNVFNAHAILNCTMYWLWSLEALAVKALDLLASANAQQCFSIHGPLSVVHMRNPSLER